MYSDVVEIDVLYLFGANNLPLATKTYGAYYCGTSTCLAYVMTAKDCTLTAST